MRAHGGDACDADGADTGDGDGKLDRPSSQLRFFWRADAMMTHQSIISAGRRAFGWMSSQYHDHQPI